MHLDAVAEGDEFGVILVVLDLLHLARLWHLGNEWFIVCFFFQRFDVLCFHLCHPFEEVFLGGQDVVFLVGCKHRHDEVAVWLLLCKLVDHIYCGGRNQLVHGVVLPLDACHWLVVEEVTHTLVHVVATLHLVAMEVGTLEGGENSGLIPLIFNSGVAIFLHTENLTIECLDTFLILIVLAGDAGAVSLLGLGYEELAITEAGAQEGCVLLLENIADALAEHA